MKKQSTKITKAIVALMMSLGSQAFAKNAVVKAETLLKNNLEAQTIRELLDEKILLETNIRGRAGKTRKDERDGDYDPV